MVEAGYFVPFAYIFLEVEFGDGGCGDVGGFGAGDGCYDDEAEHDGGDDHFHGVGFLLVLVIYDCGAKIRGFLILNKLIRSMACLWGRLWVLWLFVVC